MPSETQAGTGRSTTSYAAEVLADSITPAGKRLTTLAVTFPRFILAEVNTHRMLSRNSASSRAIPPEKQIEKVMTDPFIPETFNERVKGMGVGNALAEAAQDMCMHTWLDARDAAVEYAKRLNEIGVDKSRVNRLLEPFLWHTAIISATEWENFFALRSPAGYELDLSFPAQPEFQLTAIAMKVAIEESLPRPVEVGKWHLPLIYEEAAAGIGTEEWAMASAGRCARVSYERQSELEPPRESKRRAEKLAESGHWSPFEHQAVASEDPTLRSGNFIGWFQYRKMFPNEETHVPVAVG